VAPDFLPIIGKLVAKDAELRTRDWIKYGLAGTIALGTVGCIIALEVAKQGRAIPDPNEQRVIQQTLSTFGQIDRPVNSPPPTSSNTQ
jgi:hypothetical protein